MLYLKSLTELVSACADARRADAEERRACPHCGYYYVNPQERKPQAQRDWLDLL